MIFGIVTNATRDINYKLTKEVYCYLKDRCEKVYLLEGSDCIFNADYLHYKSMANVCDVVIVIGGDGTILDTVKRIDYRQCKIFGINVGNLGYLTDCDKNNYKQSLDNILIGNYFIEDRITLLCEYDDQKFICLNDIYFNKSIDCSMIDFTVKISQMLSENYSADNIIITTPTGSTAYNLSIGGPILKYNSRMIGITPLAPHSISSRPIVIDSNDKVKITVKFEGSVNLIGDGILLTNLKNNATITFTNSNKIVNIIKTNKTNFYEVVRKKIK